MATTYLFLSLGGGNLLSPESWADPMWPSGPPGPDDIATGVFGPTSGNITVGLFATAGGDSTFSSTITTDEFSIEGTATADAATLSASDEFLIGVGASLSLIDGAAVTGPSVADPSGPFGNAGFENFGTMTMDGFSTLKSYNIDDFGSLTITSGHATASNDVSIGDISGSASLDIESGGTLTDMLGSVGIAEQDTDVTLNGGDWINQSMIAGGQGTVTFTIQNDATLSATGGGGVFPGEPSLEVGSRTAGDVTNMTITGANTDVTVTGDAGIGIDAAAAITLSSGGALTTTGPLVTATADTGIASFDISNGSALLQVGGDATLSVGGNTTVTISTGGTMTVGGNLDAAQSGGSSASIDVNGGLLSVSGNALLGDGAAGSLTVEGGGTLDVTGTLDEGVQSGGSGTTRFSDSSDTITLGAAWIIGDAGAHSDTIDADIRLDPAGALILGAQHGGAGTLELNAESATVSVGQSVTIGAAGTGSLDVAGGASLELFSGALVVGASGAGTLSVAGTGSRVSVGHDVTIGNSGSGTVTIGQGDTLDATGGTLSLGVASGGAGTLTLGQDVVFTPGGDVSVGTAGAGSINIGAGATLDNASGALSLGVANGGKGTISLSASGASLSTQSLEVGGAGGGLLSLTEGTTVSTSGDVTLGASSGGAGTITLAAGSQFSDGGDLTVGASGGGSLDVNGGTFELTGSRLSIGDATGGSGDMSVENASLSVTGTLLAGNASSGTMSVNSQATLNATAVVVGATSGSNGTFVVDGSESEALVGSLTVGESGTGGIQVTNTALLQVTGLASMGAEAGALVQEGATVESNANWTVGSILQVGEMASAAVTVDSGGHVSAPEIVLGDAQSGASGTISLSGTGNAPSMLSFGTLAVGNQGTGELSLADGAVAGAAHTGTVEIGTQAGGVGSVTLTGANTQLLAQSLTVGGGTEGASGSGTLSVASGALVSADAATIWSGGTVLLSGGTLATDPVAIDGNVSGFGVLSGAIANNQIITASGGTLELDGTVSGAGEITVDDGAALWLPMGAGGGQNIELGTDTTLRVDNLAATGADVLGVGHGDLLVFPGVTADGAAYQTGTLTLESGGIAVGALTLPSSLVASDFDVTNANGTTDVSIACYAAGTGIATADGAVAVEALRIGQKVRLAQGGTAPVAWIGHRRIDCRRHPRRHDVWPVRIRAGAFGEGLPVRDLLLSPDHAVLIDGVLIPVRYLVNGRSIVQERVPEVTYFHVELPEHGVVLAEGLACESYLDTGNRAAFANGGTAVMMHADFARGVWARDACAELVLEGPRLAAARRRLLAEAVAAGHALSQEACLRVMAGGRSLPAKVTGRTWRVLLPQGVTSVRLVSRHWVPAHTSPGEADIRRLGVAVSNIRVDGDRVDLADPRLASGWHAPEATCRWTDGNAGLAMAGAHGIAFDVEMTGTYWSSRRTAARSDRLRA